MERIFGIFGKAWVLCNIRSFDSWGGCRTPNFGSSISCLHVYMAWLRGLVLSVHGRVDVSAVRRGCKISWCTTSPSGHATIVIKFTYALLWRSGHSSCSRVFPYTYSHQNLLCPSYTSGLPRKASAPYYQKWHIILLISSHRPFLRSKHDIAQVRIACATALIRTSLPAFDKSFSFHPWILFHTLSSFK